MEAILGQVPEPGDRDWEWLAVEAAAAALQDQGPDEALPPLFFFQGVRDITRQSTRTDPLPDPVEQARWKGDEDLSRTRWPFP